MSLKVNVKKSKEDGLAVFFQGSLDSETYTECETELSDVLKNPPKAVIFDFKDLSYISSAGLGVVFKIKQSVTQNGGTLVIANVKPNVKKVFDAVKAISEDLFATMEGTDEMLDQYINHIMKQNKGAV